MQLHGAADDDGTAATRATDEPATTARRSHASGAMFGSREALRQPYASGGHASGDVYGRSRGLGRRPFRDHHAAPEVADLLAALVEPARLDRDHTAVGLALRLLLVEHLRLGVDRVAVERRLLVLQRLDLEVGDRDAADVGHRHAEHERIDEVAHHDVLAELGLAFGEPRVRVQRMVVHRHHAEQVVVELGDRLARPVLVDVAGLEILEVTAEGALVYGHDPEASEAPSPRRARGGRARSRAVGSRSCPRR